MGPHKVATPSMTFTPKLSGASCGSSSNSLRAWIVCQKSRCEAGCSGPAHEVEVNPASAPTRKQRLDTPRKEVSDMERYPLAPASDAERFQAEAAGCRAPFHLGILQDIGELRQLPT